MSEVFQASSDGFPSQIVGEILRLWKPDLNWRLFWTEESSFPVLRPGAACWTSWAFSASAERCWFSHRSRRRCGWKGCAYGGTESFDPTPRGMAFGLGGRNVCRKQLFLVLFRKWRSGPDLEQNSWVYYWYSMVYRNPCESANISSISRMQI